MVAAAGVPLEQRRPPAPRYLPLNVRRPIAAVVVAVGLLVFGVRPLVARAPAAHARELPANLVPTSGAWFGAAVSPRGIDEHATSVSRLEWHLGRVLNIEVHFRSWTNTFWDEEAWDLANGRIPEISWTARGTTAAAIANGSQDANIERVANAIKALGQPVFLRFNWEMDQKKGDPEYIGPPSAFIAAWRHMQDIFATVGATNAMWIWCPTANGFVTGRAQSYYPGDSYVNWIAADGFNWYPAQPGSTWRSFKTIFSGFYGWASTRGKPLMIGMTGVQEDPANPTRKATWIRGAATTVKQWSAVKAFMYFDARSPKGYPFWADSSPASLAAYAAVGRDPYFNYVPLVSPDGKIAFESDRSGNDQIYKVTQSGGNPIRIEETVATDRNPVWSPDGSRVAFESNRHGSFDVFVMQANGSGVRRLTRDSAYDGQPTWSPDGSQIGFVSNRSGYSHIWVMNADGTAPRELTFGTSTDGNPAWQPTKGLSIAFDSDRSGNEDIYSVRLSGGNVHRFTADPAADADPAWSPDGSMIAFQSDREGNDDVWVLGVNSPLLAQLTHKVAFDGNPAWSPDGLFITFTSSRLQGANIWVIESNGRGVSRVTTGTAADRVPAWQRV